MVEVEDSIDVCTRGPHASMPSEALDAEVAASAPAFTRDSDTTIVYPMDFAGANVLGECPYENEEILYWHSTFPSTSPPFFSSADKETDTNGWQYITINLSKCIYFENGMEFI